MSGGEPVGVPFSNDIWLYAVPGGQIVLQAGFETYLGSGFEQAVSSPSITITPAAGGSALIGPAGTGITEVDPATYTYAWNVATTVSPGDYAVLWSATGPSSTLQISQTVTISALVTQTPGPGVYATAAQYSAWSGDTSTPASVLTPALRRATETIDLYAIGAVYAVNADGLPTDPSVIDAFMRATCAQCAFELANNDPTLTKSQFSSTAISGSISQTRAGGATMQIQPPLAPRAATILRTVGVLPSAPLLGW
jgi:hypothetical protein